MFKEPSVLLDAQLHSCSLFTKNALQHFRCHVICDFLYFSFQLLNCSCIVHFRYTLSRESIHLKTNCYPNPHRRTEKFSLWNHVRIVVRLEFYVLSVWWWFELHISCVCIEYFCFFWHSLKIPLTKWKTFSWSWDTKISYGFRPNCFLKIRWDADLDTSVICDTLLTEIKGFSLAVFWISFFLPSETAGLHDPGLRWSALPPSLNWL